MLERRLNMPDYIDLYAFLVEKAAEQELLYCPKWEDFELDAATMIFEERFDNSDMPIH